MGSEIEKTEEGAVGKRKAVGDVVKGREDKASFDLGSWFNGSFDGKDTAEASVDSNGGMSILETEMELPRDLYQSCSSLP
jgi:hypothetical protein